MDDAQDTQFAASGMHINAVADLLHQVLRRLDQVEGKVDAVQARLDAAGPALEMLDTFREKGAVVADFAATMAGSAYDTVIADQDPIALADAALPVVKKAARAENLVLADKLLDRAGDVTMLLAKLDRLEAKLAEQGTSLDAFADRAVDLTAKAAKLLAADEVTALVEVEPATFGLLDHATKALAETRSEPVKSAGLFDLLAAPFDKDIGRFLGFGLAFARRIGRRL